MLRGMERGSFVDWSFGHYLADRPPGVRRLSPPLQPAAAPVAAAA